MSSIMKNNKTTLQNRNFTLPNHHPTAVGCSITITMANTEVNAKEINQQ
jgi:hypothetical protein